MPNKNERFDVTIEGYGNSGEGIAHIDGYTLFIKGALSGERVHVVITKAKKHYGYARILDVITPSPDRVTPPCSAYGPCGGCDLQHMAYDEQLRFKTGHVRECLERIGGVRDIPLSVLKEDTPELNYRNKAQFPVGRDADGTPVAGFFAPRSHRIISCENCLLQDPHINRALSIVMDHLRRADREIKETLAHKKKNPAGKQEPTGDLIYDEIKHSGWLRHIYIRRAAATGELFVCPVVNDDISKYENKKTDPSAASVFDETGYRLTLLQAILRDLQQSEEKISLCLNENRERTNVITGRHYISLSGPLYIEDKIGDISYRIAPESFYQVNPHTTLHLYEKALEYASLTGVETVWDLYCGIGTISLFLSKEAGHVTGVEVIPEAIENALQNAEINGIHNVDFYCGKAEDITQNTSDIPLPDVIVVDPPRKGLDERLIHTIGEAASKRIVYVSCDPSTLARDIARLSAYGYRMQRGCVIDQFPQTRHVETVALLQRATV